MKTYLFVDSNSLTFSKFTATRGWYKRDPERVEYAKNRSWLENIIFYTEFKKRWFQAIDNMCRIFNTDRTHIIFARDGKDVWRYKIYPHYKAKRKHTFDIHSPGPLFHHVNSYFYQMVEGAKTICIPEAEADDICAVGVRYLREKLSYVRIVIITGDFDLLQLSDPPYVEIYKLNFERITSENGALSLFTKIIYGDKSDNIPPAFKGGVTKKIVKYLPSNIDALNELIRKHGDEQFKINQTLIDFDYIPEPVVKKIWVLLEEAISL